MNTIRRNKRKKKREGEVKEGPVHSMDTREKSQMTFFLIGKYFSNRLLKSHKELRKESCFLGKKNWAYQES